MRAASLNYRDLMAARGYVAPPGADIVPLSDGAGEIVEVGPDCQRWRAGHRVISCFSPTWKAGRATLADAVHTLGRVEPGVLTEYRLFEEDGIVAIPDTMSFEQAATLPCAGLTAWNALFGYRAVMPGESVLCLGTGGVSTFAIQLAKKAGARVIVTSSSDEKLARALALGADEGINYRTSPQWDEAVLTLTGGDGVDMVIETSGPGTLERSIGSTRREGIVQLIGAMTLGSINPLGLLMRGAIVRSVMVGSREMLGDLVRLHFQQPDRAADR